MTPLRNALPLALALLLAGCGGSSPLDNPPLVENPEGISGQQKLSLAYFQKCIQPIFEAPLPININGTVSINTCAASGCHDNAVGTGGAFRVIGGAAPQALTTDPGAAQLFVDSPEVIRASDMYKNFYSAQGEVVLGAALQSRLLAKPMVNNVLHGGGLIFENAEDANVKRIQYWITHPMPQGQDEFSTAARGMFSPADPNVGACLTE
jgi:hypothetical protein